MDKSLLLPREKYDEASKIKGKLPTFEIEKNRQVLFYFGANHSPDHNNEQYPKLRDYWQKFLDKTKGKNSIVLVEGWKRPVLKTEEEAIKNGGEGTFITLLADKEGIPTECPEPDKKEIANALEDKFSKDKIVFYHFISQLKGWQRFPEPRPNFDEFVPMIFKRVKRITEWNDYDYSTDHMLKIYEGVFGHKINKEGLTNTKIDFSNPNKEGPINLVARASSDVRDFNIASEIERYWNEGKNIFVVFGSGHLIIEEPALKQVLK